MGEGTGTVALIFDQTICCHSHSSLSAAARVRIDFHTLLLRDGSGTQGNSEGVLGKKLRPEVEIPNIYSYHFFLLKGIEDTEDPLTASPEGWPSMQREMEMSV